MTDKWREEWVGHFVFSGSLYPSLLLGFARPVLARARREGSRAQGQLPSYASILQPGMLTIHWTHLAEGGARQRQQEAGGAHPGRPQGHHPGREAQGRSSGYIGELWVEYRQGPF
jgi:hypothetical protein